MLIGLGGQDLPRRRAGSLYEIRMTEPCQQPAFIDPICSGLGRLSDLEKFAGTDRSPVAIHVGLGSPKRSICVFPVFKQQQQQQQQQ